MDERQKGPTPEEAIIQAAIECVEEYGLTGATNRRIAARAGVNLAAINYYFRSKQALIDRVMEITLENAFDWQDFTDLPGETPATWCTEIFVDLALGAAHFPGITRAHFHDLAVYGAYDSTAAKRIVQFMDEMIPALQSRGCTMEKEELRQAVAQLGYAFISSIMMPLLYRDNFSLDLTDREQIREFFGSLTEKLLNS